MKKLFRFYFPVFCVLALLAACVPYSFSPPTQIHITSGDQVTLPVIAVDGAGRSHIAGVVNNHVVYTRTTFGDPKVTLTMTMDGGGPLWYQYDPDIAATEIGTAWIVWTEQRGDAYKVACYRVVTLVAPPGGHNTNCLRLDSGFYSTGNVMVVARGSKAYALYDAIDDSGRIGALYYKELTHLSNTGKVYEYSGPQTGYLYCWDAGIDSLGYLHVAFLDNDGAGYKRLVYRSNVETSEGGTMSQTRMIGPDEGFEEEVQIDLDFFSTGSIEIVAITAVKETAGIDLIWIYSCTASGCSIQESFYLSLPTAWFTQSVITDVELVGTDTALHLGFIGDNNATSHSQVYYKASAFSSNPPDMLTENRSTFKHDLEAVKVDPRPESPLTDSFATFSWGERDSDSMEYYSFDGGVFTNVFNTNCLSSQVSGETASNGVFHAGVWKACGDTWFTTQANQVYLPVITK